ncbi:hypothetical protein JMJ35_002490 [Cladonia borealis]|uniref:Uncharacterized protein n=1 Tax=Cladonia borealis TaxID=184061 RepID=A0AA39UD35_9LECA|nr:hypothetical protein JMJ35_002490 [Cladonia borealis]
MLPRCRSYDTDYSKYSTICYHKRLHRSYEVSAVQHYPRKIEVNLSRVFTLTVYIVYNTYSITSAYSSNGSCITTEGQSAALGSEFSYTVTAGENQLEVQYLALSSFREVLGLVNCDIGEPSLTTPFSLSPTPDSPTISFSSPDPSTSKSITSPVANVTSSPDPGLHPDIPYTGVNVSMSTSNASSVAIKDLSQGQEVTVGTTIPLGITALLVLALFLWRRIKKQRAKRILGQTVREETTEDNPPFLQTKPELQGEDSRHEMPAEDRIFELDRENTRYEITTQEPNKKLIIQVKQQELRGEESALELDGRDTRAQC